MKKFVLFLTFALVGLLNAEVIKVGAVLPLTGEYEFAGAAMREGMRLGLEEFGPTKHRYKLLFEDSAFSPGKASLAAQRLINVDHVNFITSMWSPTAMAVCPIAEAGKTVHLANDWDLRWTKEYVYTLNLAPPCDEFIRLQIAILKKWGVRRIALIQENSADWNFVVPSFIDAVKRDSSMEIVSHETFIRPVRDFRTILIKIKEKNPDILLVWSILPESEIILRHAYQMGIKCRMTGYLEDLDEKALAEGRSFVRFINIGDGFASRYAKRFHKQALGATATGYDQINAIIRTCEKFEKLPTDSLVLVDTMKKLSPWQGASGMVRPRDDKFLLLSYKIVKYKNGAMVPDPDFADLNKEMGW